MNAICFLSKASKEDSWLWHRRLCHQNFKDMNKSNDCLHQADSSTLGSPGEEVTVDPALLRPDKMIMILLLYLVNRIQVTLNIISIRTLLTDQYPDPEGLVSPHWDQQLRSDNGTEFRNAKLQSFLEDVGISHNFSAVRTPQQNGVVERKNRTLVEAARSMMVHSGVPQQFWAEAITTACYTQNRTLIVKRMGKTAYEMVEQRKPNINYFRVFGCKCYVLNDRDDLGKFEPKFDESIFIGYSHNSKTYRVFNKRTRTILESSNVDFSETETYSDASPSNLNALLPELSTAPPSIDSTTNSFVSDFIDLADYDLRTHTGPIVVPAHAGSTTTSVSTDAFVTEPSSSTSTNSVTPESAVSPPETSFF
ncbi:hypothetical protein OSB04_025407 [Centaurea solstitialis]|uniref:Integrase catalytic domain-containing protein n=1 Tax=Centaurea solstitialis TaxID=347529 RepID=A0AA38SN13_9ASTR|nr:hypothetical protein OSB04_025407 [Centaurea solstitialis]